MYLTNTKYKAYANLTNEQVQKLVAESPVAIIVSSAGWHSYSSGKWSCKEDDKLDRTALLVGYVLDDLNSGRWIIKNSWGADWGEKGYIYVTMEQGHNCGIGSYVYALEGEHVKLVD